jgi:hypothetical protein
MDLRIGGADKGMKRVAVVKWPLLVKVNNHFGNRQRGRPAREHLNKAYLRRVLARGGKRRLIGAVQCESNVIQFSGSSKANKNAAMDSGGVYDRYLPVRDSTSRRCIKGIIKFYYDVLSRVKTGVWNGRE